MIDTILGLKTDKNRKSTLVMAIRTARFLTGRDVETGKADNISKMTFKVIEHNDLNQEQILIAEQFFAGIALYLIAIDCIGCLFDNTNKNSNQKNSIKRALEYFSDLNQASINAIKDLRDTLSHNFGLATETTTNRRERRQKHKFSLAFSDEGDAIKLPKIQWNGNFDNKEENYSTIIGVKKFCDLMETKITNVINCKKDGALKLRIEKNEAKARFIILYS